MGVDSLVLLVCLFGVSKVEGIWAAPVDDYEELFDSFASLNSNETPQSRERDSSYQRDSLVCRRLVVLHCHHQVSLIMCKILTYVT